jgi:outer membrane protein OmpA-like peptidoglycan-associated protein
MGSRFDMTSSRTFERWTMIAALFVLVLLSAPVRAAGAPEALLQPTPLVLKDGRIANVSIHVLPFDTGNGALARPAAARLGELVATVATDCFLTAQVIGHVSSREVADNETLAAHRLARARADAVQASLIGGGLPAKAIASVWDWQFLVREPRATLWVFRLVQGEDCEGLPLDGSASPLVAGDDAGQTASAQTSPPETAPASLPETAQAPAPETAPAREVSSPAEARRSAEAAPAREVAQAPAPAEAPRSAEVDRPSEPDLAGVVGSAVAAEAPPAAESAEIAAAAPRPGDGAAAEAGGRDAPQAAPAGQAVRAGPAGDAVPTLTRPLPALSPSQPAEGEAAGDGPPAADTRMAAVEPGPATAGAASQRATAGKAAEPAPEARPAQDAVAAATQQGAAPVDPERQGKVEWGQDNVVITFATNSSYFPPGTARRLASLLGAMESGERYRVRLEVGVSGSDTVVGATTAEEARRYNQWLAERRMSRVREWLDENASDRQLEIEPTFQTDDSSRRVVVRFAPVS